MPMSIRGLYMPLHINPALFVAAPSSVQNAWKEVQTVQDRVATAAKAIQVLEGSLDEARAQDVRNASEAVAAGKEVPPSLERSAEEALHLKRRELPALESLACQTEDKFIALLNDNRDDLQATFREAAETLIMKMHADLRDMQNHVTDLATYLGTFNWLRGQLNTDAPSTSRLTMSLMQTEQEITQVLGVIADELTKKSPEMTLRREAEAQAAWEAERNARNRYTADGLFVDTAAQNAYQR